jgi:small subunit ribosomal protein S17
MKKTIGFGIEVPSHTSADDVNSPFSGNLSVRGNMMQGEVVSAKATLTATVKIIRQVYVSKYRRYKQTVSKIKVHNPASINAKLGDVVDFIGCRPISKTKSMTIVRVVKRAEGSQ